jgi:AcrR family transcriptional regulator
MAKGSTETSRRPYEAHRERQRRRILEAAERLFDERGMDRVTMAEITAASGVRASTVYQYFANKDEIVWAILEGVFAGAAARMKAAEGAETAFGRITALADVMAEDLAQRRATVRFMAQFDAMYAREWPAERLIALEGRISAGGFAQFRKLIRDGIAEGSLRRDLEPNLTMHAVMNALIGAQRRLASLGDRVEKEYGKPVDALFREASRVILLGLRAEKRDGKKRK